MPASEVWHDGWTGVAAVWCSWTRPWWSAGQTRKRAQLSAGNEHRQLAGQLCYLRSRRRADLVSSPGIGTCITDGTVPLSGRSIAAAITLHEATSQPSHERAPGKSTDDVG